MSRPIGLVEAGWLLYRDQLLRMDVGAVQLQESRRVFFAGAAHIFSVLGALGEEEYSEDQGVATLERISRELQQFGRDVGTPRERGRR